MSGQAGSSCAVLKNFCDSYPSLSHDHPTDTHSIDLSESAREVSYHACCERILKSLACVWKFEMYVSVFKFSVHGHEQASKPTYTRILGWKETLWVCQNYPHPAPTLYQSYGVGLKIVQLCFVQQVFPRVNFCRLFQIVNRKFSCVCFSFGWDFRC